MCIYVLRRVSTPIFSTLLGRGGVNRRESSCDPRRRSQKVSVAYYKRKEAEPNFRKWYADHNDMLAELIGQDFGWNDRIRSGNADPHSGFLRG